MATNKYNRPFKKTDPEVKSHIEQMKQYEAEHPDSCWKDNMSEKEIKEMLARGVKDCDHTHK